MTTVIGDVSRVLERMSARLSPTKLAHDLGIGESELEQRIKGEAEARSDEIKKVLSTISTHGFFDLLPPNGVLPVPYEASIAPSRPPYDIRIPFQLIAPPQGFGEPIPGIKLKKRPTKIAGFDVDFPLGLPASVLAANSTWIEFFARRGFDILTYKTVRTVFRQEHPWPQWVFLKGPDKIINQDKASFTGLVGYRPDDCSTISMANSFGVPSLEPDWWTHDVRKARRHVKEGHQVLIVSVVASVDASLDKIADDFVNAALLAKNAGADIIEANYSCPNTNDKQGDLFKSPKDSATVSKTLKEALGHTPLFVKIGYLPERELVEFVNANARFINGIVAINTVSANIHDEDGAATFPGKSRTHAGVSGSAIKNRAQEVAKVLVRLRRKAGLKGADGKPISILGVGGVISPTDAFEYLDRIGVDAVETCTGAFLNPLIGMEIRSIHRRSKTSTTPVASKVARQAGATARFPRSTKRWKAHLSYYEKLSALQFTSRAEFDAAIDLLWRPVLRDLPHDLAGGDTIVIPAEAAEYFRKANLEFVETAVLTPDDLPDDELATLRRDQGPY